LELGQAFARFGLKVTIIEAGARVLGLGEPEAGAERDRLGDPAAAIHSKTAGC